MKKFRYCLLLMGLISMGIIAFTTPAQAASNLVLVISSSGTIRPGIINSQVHAPNGNFSKSSAPDKSGKVIHGYTVAAGSGVYKVNASSGNLVALAEGKYQVAIASGSLTTIPIFLNFRPRSKH